MSLFWFFHIEDHKQASDFSGSAVWLAKEYVLTDQFLS
jgi:hypothetical protein